MHTFSDITVIIRLPQEGDSAAPSSSWAWKITNTGVNAEWSNWKAGDQFLGGTACKTIYGRVTSVTMDAETIRLGICRAVTFRVSTAMVPVGRLPELQPVPEGERFHGSNDFPTLSGAYQSILDGGDISVILPEDALVFSTSYSPVSWAEYKHNRMADDEWAMIRRVKEALEVLRHFARQDGKKWHGSSLQIERRDNDMVALMPLTGGHNLGNIDECPILGGLEDMIYGTPNDQAVQPRERK